MTVLNDALPRARLRIASSRNARLRAGELSRSAAAYRVCLVSAVSAAACAPLP
jgi:hypothetical protein